LILYAGELVAMLRLLIFVCFLVLLGCSSDKKCESAVGQSTGLWLAGTPEDILSADYSDYLNGVAIYNSSIVINDDKGIYGDLLAGSHALKRKILIISTPEGKAEVSHLLDEWTNLSLEKARKVSSHLQKLYGEGKNVDVPAVVARWHDSERYGQKVRKRVLENIDFPLRENIEVSLQILEIEDSTKDLYEIVVIYLLR
jgi:hypothetical protein